jgi:hypothetical protein
VKDLLFTDYVFVDHIIIQTKCNVRENLEYFALGIDKLKILS